MVQLVKGNGVKVLDKGYVHYVDHMADDLRTAEAARARVKDTFEDRDAHLINFLGDSDPAHESPFRHGYLSVILQAPLMVARQLYKYAVASNHQEAIGWNEVSLRIEKNSMDFYIPMHDEWRKQDPDFKMGSLDGEYVSDSQGRLLTHTLLLTVDTALENYKMALDWGVAAEQARLFLPAYGLYVRWMWTASLQSFCHALNQRLRQETMWETRQFMYPIGLLVNQIWPISAAKLVAPGFLNECGARYENSVGTGSEGTGQ